MGWLTDRLTAKRFALVGGLIALAAVLVVIGDPISHSEAGEQSTGERGLVGVPRIVEITAILVALILAMPPGREQAADEDGDEELEEG